MFCDLINCSTPGFPVLHHLPEFAQSHVLWVGDATEPPHSLSSPSPPAFRLSFFEIFFFLQIFIFWMLSFNPDFSLSCFTFIKRHFSSYSLVPPSSLVPCIRIENSCWKFCVISALGPKTDLQEGRYCLWMYLIWEALCYEFLRMLTYLIFTLKR